MFPIGDLSFFFGGGEFGSAVAEYRELLLSPGSLSTALRRDPGFLHNHVVAFLLCSANFHPIHGAGAEKILQIS